jgi:hypothetical protein
MNQIVYYVGGGLAVAALAVAARRIFTGSGSSGGGGLDTSLAGSHPPPPWWTTQDYIDHYNASRRQGLNPANWGAVYRSESAFNPAAAFPQKDSHGVPLAVGIGQLTAAAGVSEDQRIAMLSMPVSGQLPIFEKYMSMVLKGAHPDTAGGIYAYNFLPGRAQARGTAPNVVLGTVAEFPLDKPLDTNGDGQYTVSDLSQHLSIYATDPLYLAWLQALRDAVGDQSISPVW